MQPLGDCDVYSQSQKTFHLAKQTGSKKNHHTQNYLNFKLLEYGLRKVNLDQ
jgi:hypothetical protein